MDITDQELSHQETTLSENQGRVLLLACGAIAREVLDIIARHGFTHLDLKCLPAILHNAPEKITPLIEEKIVEHRADYEDILVRQFDAFVWKPLGLDRHPDLISMYFGNYTKLVYQAQNPTDALIEQAGGYADKLGLEFEYRPTGYGDLEAELITYAKG